MQPSSNRATATANANIALIKYWGKADEQLIIPTTSSLSLTLEGLSTTTTVEFMGADRGASADTLSIDGVERHGPALQRVSMFLDLVRELAEIDAPARVTSNNTVPYAAGLASSSSAFAALAAAASAAAGLDLTQRELSRLARRGSGSACRSIFGGLTIWHAGHDDETSYAEQIEPYPVLSIVVILISERSKALSSREAMRRTVITSPFYPAWVRNSGDDLHEALMAVASHDIERLGAACEANALGMHAAMMASRPAVIYWLPETLWAYLVVRQLRDEGYPAWATIDAGANVKVLTTSDQAQSVTAALTERLDGTRIELHHPGPGVTVTRR